MTCDLALEGMIDTSCLVSLRDDTKWMEGYEKSSWIFMAVFTVVILHNRVCNLRNIAGVIWDSLEIHLDCIHLVIVKTDRYKETPAPKDENH